MYINVWVTTFCNMNCKYCYERSYSNKSNMGTDVADRILAYISENYSPSVSQKLIIRFHGGEPLLNYDLVTYIVGTLTQKFGREYLSFGITTNGTLLTDDISAYLLEYFDYHISISIDGDELTNDAMRLDNNNKGTYIQVTKKLNRLLAEPQKLTARMTLEPEFAERLYTNCKHLIGLGFCNIETALNYYSSNWTKKHFEILEHETRRLYEEYGDEQKNGLNIGILNRYKTKKRLCGAGKQYFNVYTDGTTFPCIFVVGNQDFVLGNILDDPFSNALIQQRICQYNALPNPICRDCVQEQYCVATRCKMLNYSLTGEMLRPSPLVCAYENLTVKMQTF